MGRNQHFADGSADMAEFGITNPRTHRALTQTYGTAEPVAQMPGRSIPVEHKDDPYASPYENQVQVSGRFANPDSVESGTQQTLFDVRWRPSRDQLAATGHFREYDALGDYGNTFSDDAFYRRIHASDVPAPDLEADFGKYILSSHRGIDGTSIMAWHNGESVGTLGISREGTGAAWGSPHTDRIDKYGDIVDDSGDEHPGDKEHAAPGIISVDPDHQRQGLARAMFRFAQFTGPHADPQKNLVHSTAQTSDGRAYSPRVPDDPEQDPVRRPHRRSHFAQGTLF